MDNQARYHRAKHDALASLPKERHDAARMVFEVGWRELMTLASTDMQWSPGQLREHLRWYMCRELKADGSDPVALCREVQAVVSALMKD